MIFELCKPTINSFCEYMVFQSSEDAYAAFELLQNAFPESCNDYLIACYGQYDNAIEFGCALN